MVGGKTCRGERAVLEFSVFRERTLGAAARQDPVAADSGAKAARSRDAWTPARQYKDFRIARNMSGGTPAFDLEAGIYRAHAGFSESRVRSARVGTRRADEAQRSLRRGGATPARRARGVQWGENPTCARYLDVGHAGGLTKTFAMRSLGAFQLVGKSRASRRRSAQGGKSAGMGYHPRPFSAASRSASVRAGHWKLPPSFPTFSWRGSQPHMEIVE
jgi:hypothetical protein